MYIKKSIISLLLFGSHKHSWWHHLLSGSHMEQPAFPHLYDIKHLELMYKIRIVPVWAPGSNSQIQLADLGSKFSISMDDWPIDLHSMGWTCSWSLQDHFQTKFFFPSFGTHFFAQTLVPLRFIGAVLLLASLLTPLNMYWCCPPPGLVNDTIKHVLVLSSSWPRYWHH